VADFDFVNESIFNKSSLLTFLRFQKKDIQLNLRILYRINSKNLHKLCDKLDEFAQLCSLQMDGIDEENVERLQSLILVNKQILKEIDFHFNRIDNDCSIS